MAASNVSASSERRVLVVSPGWIGDASMCLPALQLFQAQHPDAEISVLCKQRLLSFWEMCPAVKRRIAIKGALRTSLELLRGRFSAAYVLPNSFRSALLPWLAAVPERMGLAGHSRQALLTRVVAPPQDVAQRHQAWEYAAVLAPGARALPAPQLQLTALVREIAKRNIERFPRPVIGVMPGAARGPAKRWPAERFAEAAETLRAEYGGSVIALGGIPDLGDCVTVSLAIQGRVQNFAGATTVPEWAALLAQCAVVLCNDSGGMHLAAALGVPVVAVFGVTDPARTGPLGGNVRIIQHGSVRNREVPRESPEAAAALAAVSVAEVVATARELLGSGARHA
jgi:heptosyltransferase-2